MAEKLGVDPMYRETLNEYMAPYEEQMANRKLQVFLRSCPYG